MKKQIQLSVPKPCSQKWSDFTTTSQGGFCSTCSKVVIDFTGYNDQQICDYFSNVTTETCGRFRTDQLKTYGYPAPAIYPGVSLLKAGLLSLLLALVVIPSLAAPVTNNQRTMQSSVSVPSIFRHSVKVVRLKGIIISQEDNSPLAGVNIYLKGSAIGTVSDVNGQFEFPQAVKPGDVIVFSFIGMETKEYIVPQQGSDFIEISMALDFQIMLGAVAVIQTDAKQPSALRQWWQRMKR